MFGFTVNVLVSISFPLLSNMVEYIPSTTAPFELPATARITRLEEFEADERDLSDTFLSADRSIIQLPPLGMVADTGYVLLSFSRTKRIMSSPELPETEPCIGFGVGVSALIGAVVNVNSLLPSAVYLSFPDTMMKSYFVSGSRDDSSTW